MTIRELYLERLQISHNINEHMPLLRYYAQQCETVTEFGTDIGFSTVAFLDAGIKHINCYDIILTDWAACIRELAEAQGQEVSFRQENTATCDEIDDTDLLFIDSDHTYWQVRCELRRHAHKSRKFLIFHDILTFPEIVPAIREYVKGHYREWVLREWSEIQSGLAVYERVLSASEPAE